MANRVTKAWDALRGHSQPSLTQKDIWGQTWQAFMGMSVDEGGVAPIQDNPSDYSRAYTVEAYIYRSAQVRGDSICQVPLKCWQSNPDSTRTPIDHDALSILRATNPYGYIVGTDLMRYTLWSKDMHGHAAWSLAFNMRGNKPTEIYYEVPSRYAPLTDTSKPGIVLGGIQKSLPTGGITTVPASKLAYFSTLHPDASLSGTSKASVVRNAINLRQYSTRSNLDFFKNSMRPDWILSGEWKNTEENVESIRRNLRRHFSGESNRQPLVIGEGATAHLLTASAKDMEWLAQQRLAQEEISATFGVPLIYLSNLDRATFENIKTAKIILWHDTMIPETKILAEQMNQNFLWRFWPETRDAKIYLGFDYNEVEGLGEDVETVFRRFNDLMQRLDEQVKSRVLTPNEARYAMELFASEMGVIASPWHGKHSADQLGDSWLENFTFTPVEQHNVQAIIDIEAARSSNPNAAALIESVPGAPNASVNSGEVLQRLDQQLQTQANLAQAQIDAAKTRAASPPPQTSQRSAPTRLVAKRMNPIPQRNARLAPVQARLVKRLKPLFQNIKIETLRNIRATSMLGGDKPIEKAPIDPNASLYDEANAKARLAAIIKTGIVEAASAAYDSAQQDYQLAAQFDPGHAWIDKYMGQRLRLINGVDDNLRQQLQGILTDSAAAGDSIPVMTDKVNAVFQDAMTWRSEMIARTETLSAYGAASLQSYREAHIEQAQIYDGSDDPECAARDGQIVSMSEAEQILGEEHPNGTMAVAPVVDLGTDMTEASAPKPQTKEIFPGITLVA